MNLSLQNSETHFSTLGELTNRKEVLERHHSNLTVGSSVLLYLKEIKLCA